MTSPAARLARVPLPILGEERTFTIPAPGGEISLVGLLPAARALTDQAGKVIADRFAGQGRPISCQSGCTACCYHIVAVSLPEARDLADLVASLPQPRQGEVRRRFADTLEKLHRAGLLEGPPGERSLTIDDLGDHETTVHELSRQYFRLHLPCPFLDDYQCSIYDRRPAVCREHTVVSAPEHCAHPETDEVSRVEVRLDTTSALARLTSAVTAQPPRTIPLILALEWAERHGSSLDGLHLNEYLLEGLLSCIDPQQSNPPAGEEASQPTAPLPTLPEAPDGTESMTAVIGLDVAGRHLEAKIEVPITPLPLIQLLPVARSLAGAAISAAAEDAAASGKPVTCRAGCGACCRQLVPLTLPEARRIANLADEMPQPRRDQVRARFTAAEERLAAAGLLPALSGELAVGPGDRLPGGHEYMAQGIVCPFLENESCSIYEERPLICREYVVVSPPEQCSDPRLQGVQVLRLPLEVWRAYGRTAELRSDGKVRFVPLTLAPRWAAAHPEEPAGQSGPELLQTLLAELTGRRVAPSSGRPAEGNSDGL